MNITDLITRLEAATGPDRELDAIIHREATPNLRDMVACIDGGSKGWLVGGHLPLPVKAPEYTSSIDAALTLVRKGYLIGMNWAEVTGVNERFMCKGATTAIALCIAALKERTA